MNLTLQSLNKIKEDSSNKAIEDLLVAADRYDLVEGMHFINSQVNTTISVISNLNEAKAQLESMGYSDEWFNELMSNESFKTVLELDMPKFFDNNDNRQKACMEGFIDSLKNWIKKAIKFILDFANKLVEFWRRIKSIMDGEAEDGNKSLLTRLCEAKGAEALKKWFEAHGVKLEGYYDVKAYYQIVDNVIALVETLMPCLENPFSENLVPDNIQVRTTNVDTYAVRKEFIERLRSELKQRGRGCSNIDKDGFVLNADPAGINFIELMGVKSGKEFKKSSITIDVYEQLLEVVGGPLKDFAVAVDHLDRMLTSTATKLRALRDTYKQLEADIDNDTNLSTEEYNRQMNRCQCHIHATTIAESMISKLMTFYGKVRAMSDHDHMLLDVKKLIGTPNF